MQSWLATNLLSLASLSFSYDGFRGRKVIVTSNWCTLPVMLNYVCDLFTCKNLLVNQRSLQYRATELSTHTHQDVKRNGLVNQITAEASGQPRATTLPYTRGAWRICTRTQTRGVAQVQAARTFCSENLDDTLPSALP